MHGTANSRCEFAWRRGAAAPPPTRRRGLRLRGAAAPPTATHRQRRRPPPTAGRVYGSQLAATIHVGTLPHCRAIGLGVREIRVAAGTGADVMAGGAGAAGPTPDVRHQPPGYPDL